MVKEHYAALGFKKILEVGDETRWALQVSDYTAPELPIAVSISDKLRLAAQFNQLTNT